jgi:hypothetical protein
VDVVRDAPEPVAEPERLAVEAELRSRLEGGRAPGAGLSRTRLDQLVSMFGLDPLERDIVAALWTTAYAADWRAALAARDAVPGHLTVNGLAQVFGHRPRLRLSPESPLRVWRIVAEHPFIDGPAALSLDAHVHAWLEGHHELTATLVSRARLLAASFELPSWALDAWARRLRDGLEAGHRWRVRLTFRDAGPGDATAAEAIAAGIAKRLGVLAMLVDVAGAAGDELHELNVYAQRQAFLDRAAPCWTPGADATCPREVVPFPIQFLLKADARLPRDERLHDLEIPVALPTLVERRTLWLGAVPGASSWPAAALDDLSGRYEVTAGEVLRAAAASPRDAQEAAQQLRDAAVDDLGGLAEAIPCPFRWDDLVVPPAVRDRLEDVTFEARERSRLWAKAEAARLYPQGRGLVALFAGPPGTGKTMAAQVIAAELGLDLLRVDLSRVVSKWVGETAQHLQKVLSSVSSRRAVLLFDEADALFGKRIEDAKQAQDHFVNMDISHLMIALESYTGVVVLATNLKANIDAAFVRRIRHAVDFPMPDARAREAIWEQAAGALFGTPLEAGTREAVTRVARLDASGAQIKNAALSAVFASRRARRTPDATLLGAMLARELAKDGAGMSARELEATLGREIEGAR